jgi:hypothetical protein
VRCRGVDVTSVDFNGVVASAGAFRRENRCAAAEVGVDHDAVALSAVEHGVGDQRYWLHRRVRFQLLYGAVTPEAVGPRIIPHIRTVARTVAAEAAELNIVGMRVMSALEDEHKLVAGPVERAAVRRRSYVREFSATTSTTNGFSSAAQHSPCGPSAALLGRAKPGLPRQPALSASSSPSLMPDQIRFISIEDPSLGQIAQEIQDDIMEVVFVFRMLSLVRSGHGHRRIADLIDTI